MFVRKLKSVRHYNFTDVSKMNDFCKSQAVTYTTRTHQEMR